MLKETRRRIIIDSRSFFFRKSACIEGHKRLNLGPSKPSRIQNANLPLDLLVGDIGSRPPPTSHGTILFGGVAKLALDRGLVLGKCGARDYCHWGERGQQHKFAKNTGECLSAEHIVTSGSHFRFCINDRYLLWNNRKSRVERRGRVFTHPNVKHRYVKHPI